MSTPTTDLRIHRLSAATPPSRRRALDRILDEAKAALVSPREHLASIDERAAEADEDKARVVLYATRNGRAAGIVDATLHVPAPGDVTIAQLAVRASERG
ncbi:hypothetical protein L6R52_32160, partial [Myxococcota bacterium]|nr:hypothetical protein [Myxococcota bacterium]